mgnify:CR=1 FL=1
MLVVVFGLGLDRVVEPGVVVVVVVVVVVDGTLKGFKSPGWSCDILCLGSSGLKL